MTNGIISDMGLSIQKKRGKIMNRKGFTLIEVLMVVLIIGILASLALPQYTKVVERAKISEARSSLAAMRTAQNIYYLENDSYATALSDLSLETTLFQSTLFTYVMSGGDTFSATATRKGGNYSGGTVTVDANGGFTYGSDYKDKLGLTDDSKS